jgi:ATP-dependent Clp protease adaptor protein ClpS|tara:strand:+ start:797 stop:1093 length:297 start_codon:yes stop_codon:yes gene_type:complete
MAQTKTQQKTATEIRYPKRYNVLFLNDDFTPVPFVIHLLIEVFNKNIEEAQQITTQVHEKGKCIVATYSLEIAEQKVHESTVVARHAGHPLQIITEEV